MCGIAGIVANDSHFVPDKNVIKNMTDSIAHRGPDNEGYWIGPGVALGHRRLQVIDLEGGGQPMADESGDIVIVFNGEIYNFKELRSELTSLGAKFRTKSDTEVILQGYVYWGKGVINRLIGMFVFAIWDDREKCLLLARDRLGVKPLYWTINKDGTLFFGSELTSVAAFDCSKIELNRVACEQFLVLGYILGENSIYQDIKRFPPGSYLCWYQGGKKSSPVKYWDLGQIWIDKCSIGTNHSLDSYIEEFSHILELSIKQRMQSDVPLGAFLSGGIDSTTIVALMKPYSDNFKSFSIGFKHNSFNELPYARQCADWLGVPLTEKIVDCNSPDLLMEIASKLDEPFADTSMIPTYVLCKTAREDVTVVLSGDGGDEMLAGYPTILADKIYRYIYGFPEMLMRFLKCSAHLLPESRKKIDFVFKLKQFLRAWPKSPCDAHTSWRIVGERHILNHPSSDVKKMISGIESHFRKFYDEVDGLQALNRMLYVDYKTWLVDDILFKVDRASMLNGLEVRSPFLDTRLIEFCLGLPDHAKLRGTKGKYILKKAVSKIVPPVTIKRKKSGFNAPVSQWLCSSWREVMEDCIQNSRDQSQLFDGKDIIKMWHEHLSGKSDHGFFLFNYLMLSLWKKIIL